MVTEAGSNPRLYFLPQRKPMGLAMERNNQNSQHILVAKDGKASETITEAQAMRWAEAGFIEQIDATEILQGVKMYQLHPDYSRDQL